MRLPCCVLALLLAAANLAAEPLYIDALMETGVPELRTHFPDLRTEGCYRIGDERFLLVSIEKKDQKPWRVLLSSVAPCRRPVTVDPLDVRARNGIELGDSAVSVVQRIGRPDAASSPDPPLRGLGDSEYFYICRVDEGCARHTSVFVREGTVTAIAEWYSE